ncbi:hypothetical protein [Ancylomarina longa]|uniref:DUF4179 domain-containing protein n=1 Tax=Ancylomarina longa TaxID=2487017 RepID=A0A434AF31_9BACT|nr:hypothetical protein [Ancylomarina longa]RUT72952.1 hypothetical protein DLK05_15770 [Ancylomarina longa]
MNDLEKIIREHQGTFDDFEPSESHFENFKQKLICKKNRRLPNFLKVAVIITFVLLSGLTGYQIRKIQTHEIGLGNVSPEYREVELFYTSNINSQINMIRKLGDFSNIAQQQILSEELNDMDMRYSQLKKELQLHPDDDRIIEAMIEYYQVKTSVLNKIIEQLYQIRKQTKSNLNVSV